MMDISLKSFCKINYLECHPRGFCSQNKYPVIIHLHGAGSRGEDANVLRNQAIMNYAASSEEFPFVMFLPQCHEDCWFDVFERLKALVDNLISNPFVDRDRIFISGVSMGGYAAWQMLMSKNAVFKKAIICCGGGMYWNAARIKASVWAFHGDIDPVVFCEESRKMVDAVNRHGGSARLTVYKGVAHNCWDLTYSNPEIYSWLLQE